MSVEIRTCRAREMRRVLEAAEVPFGSTLTDEDVALASRTIEEDRIIAAVEGQEIVGGAVALRFAMTVPGGAAVPTAGVTWVGVLPTHRRRGILTGMMRHQLDRVREAGEPLAALFASEGAIYGRFGYGMATMSGTLEIDRARTAFRSWTGPSGHLGYVPAEEALRLFPPVYDRFRLATPGAMTRSQAWWETQVTADPERWRHGWGPKFYVLHETSGEADGYVVYRSRLDFDPRGPKGALEVRELFGATPAATRDLWRWVFDVDLITTIRAEYQPIDHPLTLLLADPRAMGLTIADGLWVRLVDLPAALQARAYAREGSVVLGVADRFCPWNEGSWRVEAGPDGARVTRTDEAAELTLDVEDLGSLYLGGFSCADLARAGRVAEESAGACGRADALFATSGAPWSPFLF